MEWEKESGETWIFADFQGGTSRKRIVLACSVVLLYVLCGKRYLLWLLNNAVPILGTGNSIVLDYLGMMLTNTGIKSAHTSVLNWKSLVSLYEKDLQFLVLTASRRIYA